MSVNSRELLILTKTIGVDPLVDSILTEGSPEGELYLRALDLKNSPLKSMYVEACLLTGSDIDRISKILELAPELIAMYGAVFYDVAGFDKLSKMELLNVKDRQESLLKLWAVNQGIDFIAWRLGSVSEISPVDGLKELFSTSMWKSREAMFSGNDSEASKEGLKWAKMSTDLARLLKAYTMDTGLAKRDLELALQEVIPDFEGFQSLNT